MSVLKALLWVAATLVVLIVAGVLYLSFADLGWLKPRIESAVAEATGRQLQFGDSFDLDIVPAPAIILENVSLSNAEWGSEPMLATIGHVSARLGFWSLLSGPVQVRELRLRDVDVLLETNEAGEANWMMGAEEEPAEAEPADSESEGTGSVPVILEFAELRNIKLRYLAPGADPFVASLASLDINTDEEQYTVLDGKGELDTLPWRLAGRLGPARALEQGAGIGVDLDGGLGNVDLAIDGSVGDLAAATGIDLKTVVSSDDVAKVLKKLKIDLPLSGALRIETALASVDPGMQVTVDAKAGEISASATATRQDEVISFKAAVPSLDKVGKTFEIAGLPAQDLAADGRMVLASRTTRLHDVTVRLGDAELKLDGTIEQDTDAAAQFAIDAKGPSLAGVHTSLPPIPFTAALTASIAPEQLALDGIKTSFGESDLSGSLEVATGDKTFVKGRFKSARLDLTPFAGDSEESGAEEAPPAAKDDQSQSQYVFVEEPLPFEQLGKTDIDIEAEIGRFRFDTLVLADVATRVSLKDGDLEYENRFSGTEGGSSVSKIALATGGETAALDVDLKMRDLRLNLASGDVEDASLIPPVDITFDLDSKGNSPRALASSANGRVLITQGKGRIENNLLSRFSGDIVAQLASALNPFSKEDPYTTLDCTIVALDIDSGKANIDALYTQGEKIKIVGGGDIDLNTEALNIEFNTKPRQGVGVSADMFVTPFVKLVGTLASPAIGVDKKGAVLAGAAVATGGLALVAKAAADRATGETDRCGEILAEVGGHPPVKP
jgi:uncharacterized protein involved in outer membrane biogenesis